MNPGWKPLIILEDKLKKLEEEFLKHQTLENSPISSCDTSDTECSVPVNSAIVLKRHSSSSTSPCRGHVLQKAKEWEMKNGT
ncbi:AFAP1: Actin filament associated protein 1 [Crotalus adamanteus]|uniref:AFAP1: Actin filament associated protein 1 n=1 Tax=Crotalus adamanteus TaxID=8729 RepID=A0AAW1BAY4_CROAD